MFVLVNGHSDFKSVGIASFLIMLENLRRRLEAPIVTWELDDFVHPVTDLSRSWRW